jgi:Tol biopolymer transport system component
MHKQHRSGTEAFTFTDPITGQEILQLTNSDEARSVHGYYDLPPWSPTTGQIAFTSMTAPDAEEGDVYIMDRDGANITHLAHSRAVSANGGAMAQWSADGQRVYYKDKDPGSGQRLLGWVDVDTGEQGAYAGSLRMLSPTANYNVYHSNCGDYADHEIIRQRDVHGIFVQDLATGVAKRIVTVADCLAIHPRRDEVADWHLYIKHTKWSPDGTRLMFVFTNEIRYARKYAELPRVKDVYVINLDGTGLKRVGEFGNHPLWHPNGREVLANSPFEGRPGNSLVLTDVDTGARRVASTHIAGTGHPSFSPDEHKIAVEHVLSRQGYGSINVVDVATDTVKHLAQVHVVEHSHIGTHLHPVWSQDSRQLLYASDASGIAQLCVVNVD